MTQFEKLDNLLRESNGYLQTAQVLKEGISKPTLAAYVRDRGMDHVAQGVYLAKDGWEDSLYQLQLLNRKAVYSHETALHLQGLMEREPRNISCTVPAGYNATHLRKRGIQVFQVKAETYELGKREVITAFGNTVIAYDRERTICDILKHKKKMDIQIFQYAIKSYMASNEKNLHRLIMYAKQMKVEALVRTYTEVLL